MQKQTCKDKQRQYSTKKKFKNSLFRHSLIKFFNQIYFSTSKKKHCIDKIFFQTLKTFFNHKNNSHTRHTMENIDKKNKDPKCKIFIINKSEKELSCKLEYDINGSEVVCMRCCICKKLEKRIQAIKGFNINWI